MADGDVRECRIHHNQAVAANEPIFGALRGCPLEWGGRGGDSTAGKDISPSLAEANSYLVRTDTMSLYKYTSTRVIDHLAACTIRFSPPSDFNDPFDGVPATGSIQVDSGFSPAELAADPQLAAGHKLMEQVAQDMFQGGYRDKLIADLNKNFRVLCLSKAAPDSAGAALMWGHYAQDNKSKPHAGLVLEFDESHPWFAAHTGRVDRAYQAVLYRTTRGSLGSDQRNVLFVKSDLWNYEQEVRLVRSIASSANELAGADRSIAIYPPDMLRQIYIGLYARPGIEAEIAAKLATNSALSHVRVRRITAIAPNDFKFSIAT